MKTTVFFISLLFTTSIFAENICNSPKRDIITLNKLPPQKKQLIYFGGKYSIQLNMPNKVIFSRDMLIYWYSKNAYITLHANNSMMSKNQYLEAFGLQPENSINHESSYLRNALGICNGTITQYKIETMDETIIAIHNTTSNIPNTMVYLFDKTSPFIELIQFTGFSNDDIQIDLSTLKPAKSN